MFGFFHRNATSGITIGTVTTGNTASAEITPDGKLNLVLPAMSQQAEERLTAVETQLASVEQTAQGAADDAAALTTEIQDVRSDYAADIEAARSALQGSIDTVNATVSQHTTSISNAQRTAEAAQASASALQGTVATVQGDVSTAQSTANTAVNQAAAASAAAANALAMGPELIWENPDIDRRAQMSATKLSFGSENVYEALLIEVADCETASSSWFEYDAHTAFLLRGHTYIVSVPNNYYDFSTAKTYEGHFDRRFSFDSDGQTLTIGYCQFRNAIQRISGDIPDEHLRALRVYGIRQINSNLPTT